MEDIVIVSAARTAVGKFAAANHALIHHHLARHIGARVLLDPDYNEAGQRMARAVVETLGARVDLHVTKTREVA